MPNITKSQHYVWRNYLAPWTDNLTSGGNIIVKFKDLKKNSFSTSLFNIGTENYFYDLSNVTQADIKIAALLFNEWLSGKGLMNIKVEFPMLSEYEQRDFFEKQIACRTENKGIEFLEKIYKNAFPFDKGSARSVYLKRMRLLLMKSMSGIISEEEEKEQEKALETFFNLPEGDDERFLFFEFLSFQMFRTNFMRKRIMETIDEARVKFPKGNFEMVTDSIFPLLASYFSHRYAFELDESDFFVELVENETEIEYITCDAPVVILNFDGAKEPEQNDLVLYYPVSPKIALKCSNRIKQNTRSQLKNEDEVDKINKYVFDSAERQVYAKSKDILERYY